MVLVLKPLVAVDRSDSVLAMSSDRRATSEGFRVQVRSPYSPENAFVAVTKEFSPEDPEVVIDRDQLTVVYDTVDGEHRIQGVIEIEPDNDGSLTTYGLAIDFGGIVGRIGFIRRRMAAMMQRGIAEELIADLDGRWID